MSERVYESTIVIIVHSVNFLLGITGCLVIVGLIVFKIYGFVGDIQITTPQASWLPTLLDTPTYRDPTVVYTVGVLTRSGN